MRYLKRISILTAFLLMFTLIHVTVAEDGIALDVAERIEEALEIEMDEVNADGLEALDVPLFSLEAVNLELRDAEDTQLISESEEQTETQEKANDSGDFEIDEDGELTRYRGFAKNVVIPNGVKGIGDYAFSNARATLGVKEKLTLKATVSPSKAYTILTWKSSKPAVATVSKQGVVTPRKPGTAFITVRTKNGKTAKTTVTVKAAPKKVTLNRSGTVELKKGKKLKLKATLPKDTASALTWTSSAPKVASVDKKGNVRALKKGTAVITVKTFNGRTAKVTIKVK